MNTLIKNLLVGCAVTLAAATAYCENNKILGLLEHPENFDLTIESGWINYSETNRLDSRTFDVRLPSNYNTNETYGLVSFNNSADNGSMGPVEWQPILDKYRLIWVAGDDIGNSVISVYRRGAATVGAMRMTELYNIDPARIYTAGNSGGARMAAGLGLMRDDFFTGFIGNVGASATELLPDNLISIIHDPSQPNLTLTYEYTAGGDSITSARGVYQTYYDTTDRAVNEGDKCEEEIMTCYHYFLVPNGNVAKLVDSPGMHGTKLEYAFEESVKFLEHPRYEVFKDAFDDSSLNTNTNSGNGFALISGSAAEQNIPNGTSGSRKGLVLDPDSEVRSSDVFDWNDDFGLELTAAYRSSFSGDFNQKITLSLMAGDLRTTNEVQLVLKQVSATEKNASLVLLEQGMSPVTICSFTLDSADEPMDRNSLDRAYYLDNGLCHALGYEFRGSDLVWFMDDDKFQLCFRQDIDRASLTSDLSTPPVLLHDKWTVQGRWVDMGLLGAINRLKAQKQWRLALRNQKINSGSLADDAHFDYVNLICAQPAEVAAQDGSESIDQLFIQDSTSDGRLVLEAENFSRQEVQGLHHWVRASDQSGFSGTGTVTTKKKSGTVCTSEQIGSRSSRLRYNLEFMQTGNHQVWVRGYAGSAEDDSCWIGFNEDGSDAVQLSGFTPGAYGWASGSLNISQMGIRKLYLWVGEDGLQVDQVFFTTNSGYTPTGAEPPTAASVLPPSQPPAFSTNTYTLANATEEISYSGSSISGTASDPDGDPVTYAKKDGPDWLIVSPDGSLSGTPATTNIGLNTFTIEASAVGGTDDATLQITVDNAPGILFQNQDGDETPTKTWTFTDLNKTNLTVSTGNGQAIGFLEGIGSFNFQESFTITATAHSGWDTANAKIHANGSPGDFTAYLSGLPSAGIGAINSGEMGVDSGVSDSEKTRFTGTNEVMVLTFNTTNLATGAQVWLKAVNFNVYTVNDSTDFIIIDASSNTVVESQWNQNYSSTDSVEGSWKLDHGDQIIIATGSGNYGEEFRILNLLLNVKAANFDRWAATFPVNIGAWSDDYDNDGNNNLAEYALNGDPASEFSKGVSPSLSWSGNELTFIHPKRSDSSLTYTVESTTNLVNNSWAPHGNSTVSTNIMADVGFNVISNTMPLEDSNLFLRLKIEKN